MVFAFCQFLIWTHQNGLLMSKQDDRFYRFCMLLFESQMLIVPNLELLLKWTEIDQELLIDHLASTRLTHEDEHPNKEQCCYSYIKGIRGLLYKRAPFHEAEVLDQQIGSLKSDCLCLWLLQLKQMFCYDRHSRTTGVFQN